MLNSKTAYVVVRKQGFNGLPVRQIYPAMDENSARLMGEEIGRIAESSAIGAHAHISKGAKYIIEDGDYVAGVREGWLALESATQQLTGKPDQALPSALSEIRKRKLIPQSFISELFCSNVSRFNDYANKYPGLRHASSNDLPPDMDMRQARFFFVHCVNLIGYLMPYWADNCNKDDEETSTNDNPEFH